MIIINKMKKNSGETYYKMGLDIRSVVWQKLEIHSFYPIFFIHTHTHIYECIYVCICNCIRGII